MSWIPGGRFLMGSEDFYPEEQPVRRVRSTASGWTDPVTVAEFRRFVRETSTSPGRAPPTPPTTPTPIPSCSSRLARLPHRRPGAADDPAAGGNTCRARWSAGRARARINGANAIRSCRSPRRSAAYAAWAGKELPTEAEWEFAARGGLEGAAFAWGDEQFRGKPMANTWQGEFPWQNLARTAFGTSPVGNFPANGYGLYDMSGNVWEWTSDCFTAHPWPSGPCCAPPDGTGEHFPRRSSRAARTCARRTTACATARRRGRARPSTPRRATSASAASFGDERGPVEAGL